MFDRYSDGARRVLFFGRYFAGEFGAASITTTHLTLGILQEDNGDKPLLLDTRTEFPSFEPQAAPWRAFLDEATVARLTALLCVDRKAVNPEQGVNMPLSEKAKHALLAAGETADRYGHGEITPLHLLFAMSTQDTTAGRALAEVGVTTARIENALRQLV